MKKSKLIPCLLAVMLCVTAFSIPAYAQSDGKSGDTEPPAPTVEPGEPLSQGSEFSTRDMLYDKDTHKQFITVQGRDGNIFYIVIDYDAPVNEEEEQYATYFLNQVDEADLKALLEEGEPADCICAEKCAPGAVNMDCPVCAVKLAECTGKAPVPEKPEESPAPEPEQPEQRNGMGGVLVLLLVLALAGGGAFYYLKFIKNKPKTKGSTDLDDYDYGDGLEDEGYDTGDSLPERTDAPEPEEDTEDI